MKIDGVTPFRPATVRRNERAGGGQGAFGSHLNADETEHPSGAAPAQLTRVDSLLSLQEVPDPLKGRSKGAKRGSDLLDRLEEIRHGLLLGEIPAHRLVALAQSLKAERPVTPDPVLAELLDEIELRCAVELAKLGYPVE